MELFLDTASIQEIKRWLAFGVLDGVTTNPSIMLKDGGYDMEARAKEIAQIIAPRPLSVEVYSNDPQEMLEQARTFVTWASNIVVKIPVLNEHGVPCLGVVKTLQEEDIRVNMTACMSFGQVVGGAKAGATYISIFGGRVSDEGHDAPRLVRESVEWLKTWGYRSKIIVGSIRAAANIQEAALAGAHVITVPPQFLEKFLDHQNTRATVRQFNLDAQKTLAKMQELRVGAKR
ncbi:MAG: transaldolase family protein [Chloroflexota bacterium]|nr:transaldolase family protein [Chloroflexota bacterium]